MGIAELEANLAGLLLDVRNGEVLVVLDQGMPVARLVPEPPPGISIRRATRPLKEVRRLLGDLEPLALSVDSSSLLREDRGR